MKNDIWENNLKQIDRRLSGWRSYIEEKKYEMPRDDGKVPYIEDVEVHTEEAYTGEKISCVYYEGRNYYLAGKYQPSFYARHLAEKVPDQGYGGIVFVIGFSDGRFLKELLKRLRKEVLLLVYEPCLEIFLHTLREYDVTELFSDKMTGVMVEGINGDELENVMANTIFIESLIKLRMVVMGNYEKLFPEQTDHIVQVLKKYVDNLRIRWNTIVNFSNYAIYNNTKNLRLIYDHYNFSSLHQVLPKNVPAVIVGAGPSLDKNIDELKRAKGKACIIACDTALKPLIDHGIIPDLFVIVDPKKPMELFERPQIWDIPTITGLGVPYQVMERHQGKHILYFDETVVGKIMREVFGDQWNTRRNFMGGIPTGGNVASTAFSAARLMGAGTIILVGQDMALTGEQEHAAGTLSADRKFDLKNKNLPLVEGIDGEMIPTLHQLKNYLLWFEEQIKQYPKLCVVNATEGGAKVHGSRQMTLTEAIDTYCICKREFSVEKYLEKAGMHFSKEERAKACQWFAGMPERMKELEKQVVKSLNDYEKLGHLVSRNGYSKTELKKILKRVKKSNTKLDKDEEASLVMDGLRGVEYTLRSQMYTFQDDEQKDLIESARIGYKFMNSMQVVLRQMMPVFEEIAVFFKEKPEYAE